MARTSVRTVLLAAVAASVIAAPQAGLAAGYIDERPSAEAMVADGLLVRPLGLGATVLGGLLFLAIKAVEYTTEIRAGFTPGARTTSGTRSSSSNSVWPCSNPRWSQNSSPWSANSTSTSLSSSCSSRRATWSVA